jgi:hypothetical protein
VQDPYESEESGWTDAGHYVTGCLQDWISLRLLDEDGNVAEDDAPKEVAATDEDKPVVAEPVSEPIVDPVVEPLVDNSGEEEVTDKEVADEEDMSGSKTASAASFYDMYSYDPRESLSCASVMPDFDPIIKQSFPRAFMVGHLDKF